MSAQISYWILYVTDIARAQEFYGPVMNWTFSETGSAGGVHVMESDPFGGLAPLPADRQPAAHVAQAFAPDDIDAALAKVEELGGSVISDERGEQFHGRWAECVDDQGTAFALYAPSVDVS